MVDDILAFRALADDLVSYRMERNPPSAFPSIEDNDSPFEAAPHELELSSKYSDFITDEQIEKFLSKYITPETTWEDVADLAWKLRKDILKAEDRGEIKDSWVAHSRRIKQERKGNDQSEERGR